MGMIVPMHEFTVIASAAASSITSLNTSARTNAFVTKSRPVCREIPSSFRKRRDFSCAKVFTSAFWRAASMRGPSSAYG